MREVPASTTTVTGRALRRSTVGAVLAGSVVLAMIATVSATASRSAVAQEIDTARLTLIDQDFAIEPDGTIRLVYELSGVVDDALDFVPDAPVAEPEASLPPASDPAPTDTLPEPVVAAPVEPSVQLTMEITNYAPIVDPADVRSFVGSDVDPDAFVAAVDGVAITDVRERATVGDDGIVTIQLEVDTDVADSIEERLKFDRPGLYPIRIQLLTGDPADDTVVATAGTIIQRLPGPGEPSPPPPIDLSVVTVTPAPGPDADPDEIEDSNEQLADGIDLAATLGSPVTLEVPPPLVAARAATPEGEAQLAEALAGDELVALPTPPLDVSSAAAAGRGDTFARLLSAGQDVLTAAVPTTPSRRDVWITTDALSAAGAQQLRDLGVRFIVMPRALYRDTVDTTLPATDQFVEAELPDGDTLPLLLVNPLSTQLTSGAADEILADSTAVEWAVETIAELLAAQADDDRGTSTPPERSIVISTPTLRAPDPRLLVGLDGLAATTPSVRFSPASTLIGATSVQRAGGAAVTVQLPEVAGPSLTERVALLESTALTMVSAASMLPDDDPRPVEWAAELDALISTAYSDEEVGAVLAELDAEATALTDAVRLPEPFTFTLTGRTGTIEIRLGNTSDEELQVLVQLDSSKVRFPDGDRVVTLRPNDETSVTVPVEARSNGTSSIDLVVSTPAGGPIEEPVTLTSRVTGFTGLGYLLTAGLILVLLSWWLTHWRSRRRDAALEDGRDRHPSTGKVSSDAL